MHQIESEKLITIKGVNEPLTIIETVRCSGSKVNCLDLPWKLPFKVSFRVKQKINIIKCNFALHS